MRVANSSAWQRSSRDWDALVQAFEEAIEATRQPGEGLLAGRGRAHPRRTARRSALGHHGLRELVQYDAEDAGPFEQLEALLDHGRRLARRW